MQELAAYLYITAVGFAAAGLMTSFAQLVSGEPLRFVVESRSLLVSIGAVVLRVLAGPAILMRNAWRGAHEQTRSPVWFGLSALIAGLWSLFSGAFVLDVILRF